MSSRLYYVVIVSLWFISSVAHAAYSPLDVKTVYLFRIINFIHWDNENEMVDIQFCVLGNPDISTNLTKISEGKTVRRLPIIVTTTLSQECDLLYVDSSTSADVTSLPLQTVIIGDGKDISKQGGAIELANIKGKVKPKIYLRNVGTYSISASLLRIALVEKEGSE